MIGHSNFQQIRMLKNLRKKVFIGSNPCRLWTSLTKTFRPQILAVVAAKLFDYVIFTVFRGGGGSWSRRVPPFRNIGLHFWTRIKWLKNWHRGPGWVGNGCGSFGRAVDLYTRDRQFESGHLHNVSLLAVLKDANNVTRKKSPNVYESCPNMISLVNW